MQWLALVVEAVGDSQDLDQLHAQELKNASDRKKHGSRLAEKELELLFLQS